jgi:hypothetical protein
MKRASHLRGVTITLTVALSIASSSARADECDDVIASLKKYGDGISPSNANSQVAACTAVGQLHGIMVAIREIARQCLDEGRNRDAILKDMKVGLSGMQEIIDTKCK